MTPTCRDNYDCPPIYSLRVRRVFVTVKPRLTYFATARIRKGLVSVEENYPYLDLTRHLRRTVAQTNGWTAVDQFDHNLLSYVALLLIAQ